MATYEGTCQLTNNREIIQFDMIPARTQSNPNGIAVGMLHNCSVHKRLDIDICKNCNLYREIQNVYKLMIN